MNRRQPWRFACALLSLVLLLVSALPAMAALGDQTFEGFKVVKLRADGPRIAGDVPAINFHGRTLVPLRFVGEALGVPIAWLPSSYTAAVGAPVPADTAVGTERYPHGMYQEFPVVRVAVNGEFVQGDIPAINFHGRTLVPLRLVSESLGALVTWDQASYSASVERLQQLTFAAEIPAPLPSGAVLEWERITFRDFWAVAERRPMTRVTPTLWEVTVPVRSGSVTRYRYHRSDQSWDRWELNPYGRPVSDRRVHGSPGLDRVTDRVAAWPGEKMQWAAGDLSGRVTGPDGRGIPGLAVEVQGVKVGTGGNGEYKIEGLPVGRHQVEIIDPWGRWAPASATADVTAAGGEANLQTRPAGPERTVRFTVTVPADTPSDAPVYLIGSAGQLGTYYWQATEQALSAMGARQMRLTKTGLATWEGELRLPGGMWLEYNYTTGTHVSGLEEGRGATSRTLLVGRDPDTVRDTVQQWRPDGTRAVTFVAASPVNKPDDSPVYISFGGFPVVPMWRGADGLWRYTAYFQAGQTVRYRYEHQTGSFPRYEVLDEARSQDPDQWRSLAVPDRDILQQDEIRRWVYLPPAPAVTSLPAEGTPVRVNLAVTVPAGTAGVLVEVNNNAIAMTQVSDHQWRTTLTLPAGRPAAYQFRLGSGLPVGGSTFTPAYDGQDRFDRVDAWPGAAPWVKGVRPDFQRGIIMADWWSTDFHGRVGPALDGVKAAGANWVSIYSVWAWSQLSPTPELESQGIRIGSVAIPRVDLERHIREAKQRGLKVILEPIDNPEGIPEGGSAFWDLGPRTDAWWNLWFAEMERLILDHADLAAANGVDAMWVPSPFAGETVNWFADAAQAKRWDDWMRGIIARIRTRFSGQLVSMAEIPRTSHDYQYYRDLDFIARAFSYDPTSSPAEVQAKLTEDLRPFKALSEKYGKPLVVWGVAYNLDKVTAKTDATAPDAGRVVTAANPNTEAFLAANVYEGFFRAVDGQDWIAGAHIWGWPYHPGYLPDPFSRLVIEKWYRAWGEE